MWDVTHNENRLCGTILSENCVARMRCWKCLCGGGAKSLRHQICTTWFDLDLLINSNGKITKDDWRFNVDYDNRLQPIFLHVGSSGFSISIQKGVWPYGFDSIKVQLSMETCRALFISIDSIYLVTLFPIILSNEI